MSDRRIPFTKEDEDCIASAALWGTIAAVASLGSTAINTALSLIYRAPLKQLIGKGIGFVVTLLLCIWLLQACSAFRKVARTDIADKAYLLYGFKKLHHYFLITGVLMSILFVLIIIGVILAFVLGFSLRPF